MGNDSNKRGFDGLSGMKTNVDDILNHSEEPIQTQSQNKHQQNKQQNSTSDERKVYDNPEEKPKGSWVPWFWFIVGGFVLYSIFSNSGGSTNSTTSTQEYSSQEAPEPTIPAYVRPATAPNGENWPTEAAYIKGYKKHNADGNSEITVDNSQNNSDIFAKLVCLDDPKAHPVRHIFIPAGGSFTMKKVRPGKYDLRYQDLGNGGLSKTDVFDITENKTYSGVEYSILTLSIYKTAGGNMQHYDISASEF